MSDLEATRRRLLAGCVQLARLTERVAGNADFARRGSLLLEQGQLELGPFTAVQWTGFGDWQTDPLRNRSWQWRLNWLSFVSYLVAHHAASGELSALRLAVEATQSWLDHFGAPARRHPFEFAWHDHGTALRSEQMALLVHRIEQLDAWDACGGTPAAEQLLRALREHAELLAHDAFFSRHTNHGLEQARVLLLLGTAMDIAGGARAADWRASALARIESELRHAFTDEGVHVENSPAYHAFVFKVFLGIVGEYPLGTLGPLHRWMTDVGPLALEFLARILRPDGVLPIIGDTEALPVTDSFKSVFDGLDAYQAFRYAKSLGRVGRPPEGLHKVYPRSGYAIFRDAWLPAANYRRGLHIVVKAGASSRYHRQQDDGHLVVFAHGEDWLIDSGMFGYDSHSPIRQYMRSRAAHNVALLDRPFAEHADPAAAWQVVAWDEKAAHPFLEVLNRLYVGATLLRRVSVLGNRGLSVQDTVCADDGEPVDVTVLWHVPADKQVRVAGPREVLVSSKQRAMRIRLQGDLPVNVELHCGIAKGKVRSVVSKTANSHEPSQVVVFRAHARKRLSLQFDLTFELT